MRELTILSGSLISPPDPRRPRPDCAPTIESDADYFERRASAEMTYAAALDDPQCRALHIELASRYAQLATAIRQTDRSLS